MKHFIDEGPHRPIKIVGCDPNRCVEHRIDEYTFSYAGVGGEITVRNRETIVDRIPVRNHLTSREEIITLINNWMVKQKLNIQRIL